MPSYRPGFGIDNSANTSKPQPGPAKQAGPVSPQIAAMTKKFQSDLLNASNELYQNAYVLNQIVENFAGQLPSSLIAAIKSDPQKAAAFKQVELTCKQVEKLLASAKFIASL